MLTPDAIEVMRHDASLARTRSYGYPEARRHCADHVETLLAEMDRLRAELDAYHGDWGAVRRLAGLED
jgi:hypothetical protein